MVLVRSQHIAIYSVSCIKSVLLLLCFCPKQLTRLSKSELKEGVVRGGVGGGGRTNEGPGTDHVI